MTTVKMRLVGRPADVEAAAARLRRWFTVLDESSDYPRRDEPGHVARYVTVSAPALGLGAGGRGGEPTMD